MIVGSDKIRRLMNLAERITISTGIDSVEVAKPISDAAAARGLRLPVLIKIDSGLGRLGVQYGDPALELARKIRKMPGLELRGIYTHEGFVYAASDLQDMRRLAIETGERMVETAEILRDDGARIDVVSVGATPSALMTCTVEGVTETRPGTYVFNDSYQVKLGIAKIQDCALSILATVISTPAPDRAVIDAGTKSFSSDKAAALGVYGRIKDMPHLALVRAYEEHGVLDVGSEGKKPQVGDKLEIIPNHVCPAVNLFDELVGVRDEIVTLKWKVAARGLLR